MRLFILLILSIAHFQDVVAQYVFEAYTTYNDSFREWEFSADFFDNQRNEWYEESGTISQIFSSRNDWSEWRIEIDDLSVECRLKWRDNPNHWVMYTPDDLITMRTVWRNDMRKWKIVSNSQTITIETKYRNIMDSWSFRSKSNGQWNMYMDREGDPRYWIIEDDLDSSIDIYHKLAMTFIVLHHSSPKI